MLIEKVRQYLLTSTVRTLSLLTARVSSCKGDLFEHEKLMHYCSEAFKSGQNLTDGLIQSTASLKPWKPYRILAFDGYQQRRLPAQMMVVIRKLDRQIA